MKNDEISLCVHPETVAGVGRVQVGPFGQVIGDKDAALIAKLAASVINKDVLGTASFKLLVNCSNADSKRLRSKLEDTSREKWEVLDERGLAMRVTHLGSVLMQTELASEEELARAISLSWSSGRVLIRVGERHRDLGRNDWMQDAVDPPSAIIQDTDLVIASFFHGAWIAVYSKEQSPNVTADEIIRVGRTIGRTMQITHDPL